MFILHSILYGDQRVKGTRGYLLDSNFNILCPTLELPYVSKEAEKAKNVSCIPEGIYEIVADKTGKYQWWAFKSKLNEYTQKWEPVFETIGRSNIEIHPANYLKDLEGCIALGETPDIKDNELVVWSSQLAHKRLQPVLKDRFILKIVRTIL